MRVAIKSVVELRVADPRTAGLADELYRSRLPKAVIRHGLSLTLRLRKLMVHPALPSRFAHHFICFFISIRSPASKNSLALRIPYSTLIIAAAS